MNKEELAEMDAAVDNYGRGMLWTAKRARLFYNTLQGMEFPPELITLLVAQWHHAVVQLEIQGTVQDIRSDARNTALDEAAKLAGELTALANAIRALKGGA